MNTLTIFFHVLFGFIILLNLIFAIRKNASGGLWSMGFYLVSIGISFCLSKPFSSFVSSRLISVLTQQLDSETQVYLNYESINELISILSSSLLRPLFFTLLTFLIYWILLLIFAKRLPTKGSAKSKFVGAIISLTLSVVMISNVLIPIGGTIKTMANVSNEFSDYIDFDFTEYEMEWNEATEPYSFVQCFNYYDALSPDLNSALETTTALVKTVELLDEAQPDLSNVTNTLSITSTPLYCDILSEFITNESDLTVSKTEISSALKNTLTQLITYKTDSSATYQAEIKNINLTLRFLQDEKFNLENVMVPLFSSKVLTDFLSNNANLLSRQIITILSSSEDTPDFIKNSWNAELIKTMIYNILKTVPPQLYTYSTQSSKTQYYMELAAIDMLIDNLSKGFSPVECLTIVSQSKTLKMVLGNNGITLICLGFSTLGYILSDYLPGILLQA